MDNITLMPEDQVSLVDLIGEAPEVAPFNGKGAAVEAGKLALLAGDNETALKNYDYLMGGFNSRDTSPVKALRQRAQEDYGHVVKQQLLSVLADPSLSMEQKQAAVDAVREGKLDNIPTDVILTSENLAAMSEGEDEYDENVRFNAGERAIELTESFQNIQGIINGVKAASETTLMEDVGNLLERFLTPAEQGISLSQIQVAMQEAGLDEDGSRFAPLLLPGTAIENLRERIGKMSLPDREAFAKELVDILNNNSGLLASNSNQSVLLTNLDDIFGDYDTTDKYVDNIFNILDMVGIGAAAKAGVKLLRGKKAAENIIKDPPPVVVGEARQQSTVPTAAINTEAKVDANALRVEALEKEIADTLPQASTGKLEKSEVSKLEKERDQVKKALDEKLSVREGKTANQMLERRENLQNTLKRIEERLSANASASQAEQRLRQLEEQLAQARKAPAQYIPAQLNPVADAIRRTRMQSTVMDDMSNTAASILFNTNPKKARDLRAAVYMSGSDELAVASFGVGRAEALAKGIIPQVTTESGIIRAAPTDLDKTIRAAIVDEIAESPVAGLQFTPREIASARANVVNDFQNITGLELHSGMSSFKWDGDVAIISGVYTKANGGWLLPEHAIEQAKFALRHHGVTDSEIKLLKKEGAEYVPVDRNKVSGVSGDYVVQLDTRKAIEVGDIKEWSDLDVKRNFFDRIPSAMGGSRGTLNRHAFEPASTLHPIITGAAVAATDRASLLAERLLTTATRFSDKYAKLSAARKSKVFEYIKEANLKEIAYDPQALKAQGFTDFEIGTLKDWRDTWDSHYYLENLDIVRSLRGSGYEILDNGSDTFIAKAIPKNRNIDSAYDPSTGVVIKIDSDFIENLYNQGGTLSRFRRETNIGNQASEYMIVRNTPTEYLRKVRDDDRILTKKEGYYQITYNAPRFIEETYKNSAGVMKTRTIAVAGTRKEADQAIKLMQNQNPGRTYSQRGDERAIRRDSDEYWDLNSVGGRIAQRHRGKLLEDAVGVQQFGKADFIDNPADSAIKAIMSVSGRTAMRPVLDASKERFVRQYGKFLTPDPQTHTLKFPSDMAEIKQKGEQFTKELADARTTFEYIRYLENGYINDIDVGLKATFNVVGEIASKGGVRGVERLASKAEQSSVTGGIKGAVFAAYLASNPLRQWIVQPFQVTRTWAYNPRGIANSAKLVTEYGVKAMGGKVSKDGQDFYDFLTSTGMMQAVSKNNLVRGTLLDISERRSSVSKLTKAPAEALRKGGFDIGEKGNILGHSASVFDKYKRAGYDVRSKEVRAQMHQEARALMWDMNAAGDMPYNQNALSLVMTYMQVPHKAVLTSVNRRLSRGERARLVTADLAMWGLPVSLISYAVGKDWLPDDDLGRQVVTDGVASVALNSLFSHAVNGDVNIDWSSLAPNDMDGWREMVNALMFDGGVKAMIDRSPASQVFGLDSESRLGAAIKMTSGFFVDSFRDEDIDPDKLLEVADAWGRISSGWNNYQKARAMYALGVAKDKRGNLTDTQVSKLEAVAQAFGFGTLDTKYYYETMMEASKEIKDRQEQRQKDAKEWMQLIAMRHNNMLPNNEILRLATNAYMVDMREGEQNDFMLTMAQNLFNSPNDQIMSMFSQLMGIGTANDYRDYIRNAPVAPEQKQQWMEAFDASTRAMTKE